MAGSDQGRTFGGFSPQLIEFLEGLSANNNKAWFEHHRDDYEALFKEPARQFVTAISGQLGKLAPDLKAEPKIGRSIHRINRDTRFSKDKTPYRPLLHFVFWRGAKPNASPAFHFVIGPRYVGVGAGMWALMPGQLEAYRDAVANQMKAAALAAAIENATKIKGIVLDPPALKRLPAGYEANHPHNDLLRYKGIVVRGEGPIPKTLFGAGAIDLALDRLRPFVAVHDWLVTHLASGSFTPE
ncbi:MAG: DUF2461 domain-containing protein [Alphaproteobacteria bacterium]|nr:DUF2461 domain-containing protein [Alphaproteobacteria bacterium]